MKNYLTVFKSNKISKQVKTTSTLEEHMKTYEVKNPVHTHMNLMMRRETPKTRIHCLCAYNAILSFPRVTTKLIYRIRMQKRRKCYNGHQ